MISRDTVLLRAESILYPSSGRFHVLSACSPYFVFNRVTEVCKVLSSDECERRLVLSMRVTRVSVTSVLS